MISTTQVINWLRLPASEQIDNDNLLLVVASVNQYVSSLPDIDIQPWGDWSENTVLGATMLAARVYRRRSSVNGIESFTEGGGGTAYVSRYDSDIARLLHTDIYQKPRFF
jgi:hypothetical protein